MWIQFFLSAILGLFAELCYLLTSYLLDKTGWVSVQVSNFFGLLVDGILDYVLQSLLFLGVVAIRGNIVGKFLIFRVLEALVRQLMYMGSLKLEFVQKYVDDEKEQEEDSKIPKFLWYRQTHVRYIVVLICFFILTFPMRKYFVFVKAPTRI